MRLRALSAVFEKDILQALESRGLKATRTNKGWRGCDQGIDGRYVWWPKVTTAAIRCLHLGSFDMDSTLRVPIENGRVRVQLEFRGASRESALAAIDEAARLLVQRR